MQELTKAEEQAMKYLWKLKKAFVKDIVDMFPEPKPAYNTVSTIIRILEKKGFVSHKAYGKSHEYFPLIEKKEYAKSFMKNFVRGYFENSYNRLTSFFAREENLSVKELEEIKKILDEEIKKRSAEDK